MSKFRHEVSGRSILIRRAVEFRHFAVRALIMRRRIFRPAVDVTVRGKRKDTAHHSRNDHQKSILIRLKIRAQGRVDSRKRAEIVKYQCTRKVEEYQFLNLDIDSVCPAQMAEGIRVRGPNRWLDHSSVAWERYGGRKPEGGRIFGVQREIWSCESNRRISRSGTQGRGRGAPLANYPYKSPWGPTRCLLVCVPNLKNPRILHHDPSHQRKKN